MRLTSAQLDRAAGALVGGAAGDALGAGYEFGAPAPPDPQMIGGGIAHWAPGEWTDDTQMAICIAEEAATGAIDVTKVAGRFLAWYREGQKDVGIQTSGVLRSAKTAADVAPASAAYFAAHPHGSAGNGSLMRTGPVALTALGDPAQIAATAMAISSTTHGDPLAGEACVLWSVGIDRAIRSGTFDGVRDGLAHLPADRAVWWAERLDEAEQKPPSTFNPNGFVVPALQAAWGAITQTPVPSEQPCRHLQHALAAAVRVGHDTDTVAAIAGSLLGARWGSSAVPLAWRRLMHGWPAYRTPDLVRLAVLAANSGHVDSTGWPTAATLLPYYEQRFSPRPDTFALPDDDGVVIGSVAGLKSLPPDIDLAVSLCRAGRHDVPDRIERFELWLVDEADPEHNPNLDFLLTDIARQMVRWRGDGRRIYLHCVMAESRTPSVAAAYLAERLGISGAQALDRVRALLPRCRPNAGFAAAVARLWP